MIAITDYGVGNLFSLRSSFSAIGQEAVITSDPNVLAGADKIILPGVGAFRDAAEKLKTSGLGDLLTELAAGGKPLLGICLGMQLLFDESLEFGRFQGLGLIPGRVVPFKGAISPELKIPHIGWNALSFSAESPLLGRISEGDCVYFVHSYYASDCDPYVIARTEYGIPVTACVQRGNIYGCQFHPEKSGDVGLNILRAFCLDC